MLYNTFVFLLPEPKVYFFPAFYQSLPLIICNEVIMNRNLNHLLELV